MAARKKRPVPGPERRRRPQRAPDPGAAGHADHPALQGRLRGAQSRDCRRHPPQPGRAERPLGAPEAWGEGDLLRPSDPSAAGHRTGRESRGDAGRPRSPRGGGRGDRAPDSARAAGRGAVPVVRGIRAGVGPQPQKHQAREKRCDRDASRPGQPRGGAFLGADGQRRFADHRAGHQRRLGAHGGARPADQPQGGEIR